MMINDQLKAQLRMLKDNNVKPNYAELARQHGCDYRTIKRYYEGYEGKPKNRNKPSKLDPYKELIRKKLSIERISERGVYEFLVDQYGEKVIGTYSNFNKYVNAEKLLPKKKPVGLPRFETDKGYQAQVDWKENITLQSRHGEVFTFNIFNFEMGYSRHNFIYYSVFKDQSDVFRCMIRAFKALGGVPARIVFDNMSTAAVTGSKNKRKEVNPKMRSFAKDFGFEVYLCKPRHPYTKGKVEARNKMLDWIRAYDNDFEDEKDLIRIIEEVIGRKMNAYDSQAHGFPPVLLLQEEIAYLKALPGDDVIDHYLGTQSGLVDDNGLVYYKGNQYSVDPAYIDKRVIIERHEDKLYFYYDHALISVHNVLDTFVKKAIRYHEEDYRKLMEPYYSEDSAALEQAVSQNLKLMDRLIGERNAQSADE